MKARLSWSEGAPSEQGTGFKIYRSENGGDFSLRATLPLSTTTYDDDIQPNVLYTYRVYEYLTLSPGGNIILSPYAEIVLFVTRSYDSAVCLDAATSSILIFGKQDVDYGSGVDQTIFLSAALLRSDMGRGSEFALGTCATSTAEHGELADSASVGGFLNSLDTNLGSQELIPWLGVSVSESDLAEATELFEETTANYGEDEGEAGDQTLVYAVSYPQDNGTALEALFILLPRLDSASTLDSSRLCASLSEEDFGQSEEVPVIAIPILDLGAGEELQDLQALVNALDSGLGAEFKELLSSIRGLDQGIGEEGLWVYAYTASSDLSQAQESAFLEALLSRIEEALSEERASLVVNIFWFDSGIGEELSPNLLFRILEEAQAQDATSLHSLLSRQDSSQANEAWGLQAAIADLDTGLGICLQQLLNSLSTLDQGSGEEAFSIHIHVVSLDLGLGAETSLLNVLLAEFDRALGKEPASVTVNLIRLDTGIGEELCTGLIHTIWDTGEGHEATELGAAFSWQDSGQGVDLSALLALMAHGDQGESEEHAPFPYALILGLDVPSAEDEALVSAFSLAAECGRGQDFTEFEGTSKDLDQGTGQERKYFLFIRNPGSPWGWKIYELTGIPESILRAARAQGETLEPSGSKVAKPKAVSRG